MSYKKDVILQIREEEKLKKLSFSIAKKLEKMTPAQREEFIYKLTKKARILNAELKDLKEQDHKLYIRKTYRTIPDFDKEFFWLLGGVVFGMASGLISAALFSVASVSAAIGILCIPISIAGMAAGAGLTALGMYLAENKVISNFIAKVKQKIVDSKQNKLKKDKEQIQIQLDKAQEMVK